jgi:L-fuculose-phosphate aldolase
MDVSLHQLVYRFTPAGAVIHAHPAHAVALSLVMGSIEPLDVEGAVLLKEIPVLAPEAMTDEAPQLLQTRPAVMARGHGCYVTGRTLEEALAYTTALALSAETTWLALRLKP